ncbi:MAG: hypothetical protein AB7V27_16125 [Candidatus Binatia bacterium]
MKSVDPTQRAAIDSKPACPYTTVPSGNIWGVVGSVSWSAVAVSPVSS